jgi:DNA-binding GntR family transcriptional regulator
MHLFRRRSLSKVPNVDASLAEHRDILDAIERGDADAAREAGRIHVVHGCRRFLDTLDEADASGRRPTRTTE